MAEYTQLNLKGQSTHVDFFNMQTVRLKAEPKTPRRAEPL